MIFRGTGFLFFLGICAVSLTADVKDCRSCSYVLKLVVFDEPRHDFAPAEPGAEQFYVKCDLSPIGSASSHHTDWHFPDIMRNL